jgi:hypothetical protein
VRWAHVDDRSVTAESAEAERIGEVALEYLHEADLYEPIQGTLKTFWDELEEARRVEPDPERLDEFIAVQLPQEARDEIAREIH